MFERCATQKQKLLISSEEGLNLTVVHVAEIPGSIPGYGTDYLYCGVAAVVARKAHNL